MRFDYGALSEDHLAPAPGQADRKRVGSLDGGGEAVSQLTSLDRLLARLDEPGPGTA